MPASHCAQSELGLFDFVSGDMRGDMLGWSEFIRTHGGLRALRQEIGNYPPLYYYLLTLASYLPLPRVYAIKVMYVVFDYVMAGYVWGMVRQRYWTGRMPAAAALATLFLPTVGGIRGGPSRPAAAAGRHPAAGGFRAATGAELSVPEPPRAARPPNAFVPEPALIASASHAAGLPRNAGSPAPPADAPSPVAADAEPAGLTPQPAFVAWKLRVAVAARGIAARKPAAVPPERVVVVLQPSLVVWEPPAAVSGYIVCD